MGEAMFMEARELTPSNYKFASRLEEMMVFKNARDSYIAKMSAHAEQNEILQAQIEMARDNELVTKIVTKINKGKNAQVALKEAETEVVSMLLEVDDEYIKERSTDIRDICKGLMCTLKNIPLNTFDDCPKGTILVAKELMPTDLTTINFENVVGFVTKKGGITGHLAILAKNMGVMGAVGVKNVFINSGDYIIIDSDGGKLIINPDDETKAYYEKKLKERTYEQEKIETNKSLDATTKDGRTMKVYANVTSVEGIGKAMKNGAVGVGLFRTEFLYARNKRRFPTEDEQTQVYIKAVKACKGGILTLRTLDIGGDKDLPYYKFEKEENPFLGRRGIRLSFHMEGIFVTQLRAMLKASAQGKIEILLPMITSVEEYRRAKELLGECKNQLRGEGVSFDEDIKLGVLIETPAAVFVAEELAEISDFFSIGTNDLTQYILAVDRGNENIAHMYDSLHPAVLRAIKIVIDAGKIHNRPVKMCGELASDARAIEMLIKMGLEEFSVAVASIAEIKHTIREVKL